MVFYEAVKTDGKLSLIFVDISKMSELKQKIINRITDFLKQKGMEITSDMIRLIEKIVLNTKFKFNNDDFRYLFDSRFPYLPRNYTGSQNSIQNLLILFLWMKIHDPLRKEGYTKWMFKHNITITLSNTDGSEYVYMTLPNNQVSSQKFQTNAMICAINEHMMTETELSQQKTERQEQLRLENELKLAHNSIPQRCGGVGRCSYCNDPNDPYYSNGF